MLEGVMLLWFVLTVLSVLYVAIDVRRTPESPVLKWAFVLITAYIGPLGAFLYVLGCREPLPGLHERYVAVRWRQVLGSTMHCVAGDGLGILAGAVIAGFLHFSVLADIALEYALGFGFGWMIFQAMFMRDTTGGSYPRALATTFMPELVSMNVLMAGMVPVMTIAMANTPSAHSAVTAGFWFIMSMALLAGFVLAYPMNWWLVARGLKHGMMTVWPPPLTRAAAARDHGNAVAHEADRNHVDASTGHAGHGKGEPSASNSEIVLMGVLSFAVFALGLVLSYALGGLASM
jgi:Domain of unknown function (DUF4396)